jgi:NADH-quinone oxidoreductase subunit E
VALEFSKSAETELKAILGRYPDAEAAVIPALILAAREFGSVGDEAIHLVAARLGVHPSRVRATATFYTMLPRKPLGKYHLQVCTNISCSLLGADHVMNLLEAKLGVRRGQTTEDGLFTLSEVECLGSCGTAPVMMINDDYFENLDEGALDDLIAKCRDGKDLH